MEVDFPSRRDFAQPSTSNNSSSTEYNNHNEESLLSGVTSTSSQYEGGGSLLWPSSTDDEGGKKKRGGRNRSSGKRKARGKQRNVMKHSHQQQQQRRATMSSCASSNYEAGAGEMAVDFPTDRTPFMRRYSHDSSLASGAGGGENNNNNNLSVMKEEMKQGEGGRSLSRSNSMGSIGSNQSSSHRRRRRISHSSSHSSYEGALHNNNSNSERHRRRRRSIGSGSRGSEDAMNAFTTYEQQQKQRRRSRSRGSSSNGGIDDNDDNKHRESLQTTQSLREKELRQSLRASLQRRNSRNSLMSSSGGGGGSKSSASERCRRPSMERRPSKDDLIEREHEHRSSLVAAHNANASALPILGWDVENQSDTSSFLNDDSGRRSNSRNTLSSSLQRSVYSVNSAASGGGGGGRGGLQRSFHSASVGSSFRSLETGGVVPVHHATLPKELSNSLNDNPHPEGELFGEFMTRGSFHQNNQNNNGQSGGGGGGGAESSSGGGGSPVEQQDEYDARKPWRKAPATAVNVTNDRRTSSAKARNASVNSMNFDPDVMKDFMASAEFQRIQRDKESKSQQEDGDEEKELERKLLEKYGGDNDDDDDDSEEEQLQSPRSQVAQLAALVDTPPSVEGPPEASSESQDASARRRRDSRAADDTTEVSSLARDDDDSELTDLRIAQEALFPIQEGYNKKSTGGSESVDASLRQSELSDISFGVEALENSDYPLPLVDGDRKPPAHKYDVSLDIVREEDHQLAQERASQQQQKQKQQQMEDIIKEQEQIQKQQEERERERQEQEQDDSATDEIKVRRLSSNDFGANQIRKDLQLDDIEDLPSSAGDIFAKRNSNHNDSDTFSDVDMQRNTTASLKVCLNVTDDRIENEFSTTRLEDVEFGNGRSRLHQEEEVDNLDVSELGLLFEANRKDDDDILEDSSSHEGGSAMQSGKSGRSSSKRTSSTLESAFKPFKNVIKRSASNVDSKTTSNIRRRNKRMWKFCVWNIRKISVCIVLLLAIMITIGVLAWLGAEKSKEKNSPQSSNLNLQLLERGPTQYPSLTPSLSSSPTAPSVIVYDGPGPGDTLLSQQTVNETHSKANSTDTTESGSVTEVANQLPSKSDGNLTLNVTAGTSESSEGSDNIASLAPTPAPEAVSMTTSAPMVSTQAPNPASSFSPTTQSTATSSSLPSSQPSTAGDMIGASPTLQSDTTACAFCERGITDLMLELNPGQSCADVQGFAFKFPNGSDICAEIKKEEIICCPEPPEPLNSSPESDEVSVLNSTSSSSVNESLPAGNDGSDATFTFNATLFDALFSSNSTMADSEASPVNSMNETTVNTTGEVNNNTSFNFTMEDTTDSIANETSPVYSADETTLSTSEEMNNYTLFNYTVEDTTTDLITNETYPMYSLNETTLNTTEADFTVTNTTFLPELNDSAGANTSMYTLIHNLTGNNEYDYAGSSVAISPGGDFVAIGFKEAFGLTEKSGVVRVYQRLGEMYVPLGGELLGNATGDEFGASVSMSNDGRHVAIGARGSSSLGKIRNGEVQVFQYDQASSTWLQIGSPVKGLDDNDEFGFSVSLSGDGFRFASGSPGGNERKGSAGVYQYDGEDWMRIGDTLIGADINDRYGFSVSLSSYGDILAVGAYSETVESMENCGSVNVYNFSGSNWTNIGQRLIGKNVGAHFGWATSLSGNGQRIVIGSKGHMVENVTNVGVCEVFELNDGNWTQIGELLGEKESDETGRHVSMALDGTVFSCSKLNHFDDGSSNGEVVILEEVESGGWNIVGELKSSQGISPSFGSAVGISEFGEYTVVGAEEYATSRGAVDILIKAG
jgi:hypothetical protein